jgi:hypothetical protein
MSSTYERSLTELEREGKRSLVYIRKRIGEIGLPCGTPASRLLNSSIWLSKESLKTLFSKKEETQIIRGIGRRSFWKIFKS